MHNLSTSIPQETLRNLDDTARRHDKDRDDLVRLAIDYYLNHIEDMQQLMDEKNEGETAGVDWAKARDTFQHARCSFDECPLFGECPAGACLL